VLTVAPYRRDFALTPTVPGACGCRRKRGEDEGVLGVVGERVADYESRDLVVGEDVLAAVVDGTVWHERTRHRPTRSIRHGRTGAVDREAVVERAAARSHRSSRRLGVPVLRVEAKDGVDVRGDPRIIERRRPV
jgi:hypothetical protein